MERLAAPRVVSLHPAGTDTLASLGLLHLLVGRSHECDAHGVLHVPVCTESKLGDAGGLSSAEVDAASTATSTGLWDVAGEAGSTLEWGLAVYRTRLEALRTARPDVILTQVQSASGVLSVANATASLTQLLGYTPVLVQLESESLEDVWADMQAVADACHAHDTGSMVVAHCKGRLQSVAAARLDAVARPRVAVIQWPGPIYAAGAWVPALIDLAGGHDALAVPPGGASLHITPQQLCSSAPDVIILALCGVDMAQARGAAPELAKAVGQDAWQRLPAVRTRRVYAADAVRLFSRATGSLLADTVELLAALLHGTPADGGQAWCRISDEVLGGTSLVPAALGAA